MKWFLSKSLISLSFSMCFTAACASGLATPSSQSPTPELTLAALALTPTLERPRGMTPTPTIVVTLRPLPTRATEGIVVIDVGDYYFYPQVVTVTVGTTVIWNPVGELVHTIVPVDPPSPWKGGGTGGAGTRAYQFIFNRPGTYKYTCRYHPGEMDAWVVVIEDS